VIAPRRAGAVGLALVAAVALAACDGLPGKPKPGKHDVIPSQIVAFDALYARHCAGCHGAEGRLGAARPLNDRLYLALVPRERLRQVIARGVPGTSQPAFAQSAGGDLTDAQIDALVQGLLWTWGRVDATRDAGLPAYDAPAPGDPGRGQTVFAAACAACHGPDGRGGPKGGSVVDPSYLNLVSDQGLRTTVIAGRLDLGMPDWRGYVTGQPLTPQQVSDVTAWLVAQRRPVPGRLTAEPGPRGPAR
jgi:cytochrome c oxidase cbb3-type subunit III